MVRDLLRFSNDNEGSERLRYRGLIFLALGIQVFAVLVLDEIHFGGAKGLLITSYVILLLAILLNIRRSGMALVFIGAFLNFLAITANGGSMPLDPRAVGLNPDFVPLHNEASGFLSWSKDTLQLSESTRLWFLGDVFPFPGSTWVFSPGDVFIAAGILLYAFYLLLRRRPGEAASLRGDS